MLFIFQTNHNPGIYFKGGAKVKKKAVTGVQFGIYSLSSSPGAGWTLMTIKDLLKHKAKFVHQYNKGKGIPVIKPFKSGSCCFAVKGGQKLTVAGSPFGYQFPATTGGTMKCNPAGGYADGRYQFYLLPKLSLASKFSSKPACQTKVYSNISFFCL